MNHSRSYYRYQRARHKKRDKCYKKHHDHKNVKDVSREEAMNESERYFYSDYGYGFEEEENRILANDLAYHWMKVEEDWYYEENDYLVWLEDHPNGSTD